MTIKEAVLKSLEDLRAVVNYMAVYDHIIKHRYYDFKDAKTPAATVSAQLGDFIRKGDTRVNRIGAPGGNFSYYLTKYGKELDTTLLAPGAPPVAPSVRAPKGFDERSLHPLLSTYLRREESFARTIFHERSTGKDNQQKWIHPDMVAVRFPKLRSRASQSLFKAQHTAKGVELSSYEIKKEVNSDYDLKRSYFQAVSNSSWANTGYLVAFQINHALLEELERLNASFGIGVIELRANPFESVELFPARQRELDFRTIDKLCVINPMFERFIEQTEKILSAEDKYLRSVLDELDKMCDHCLADDPEIVRYCQENHIPFEAGIVDHPPKRAS